MSSNNSTSASLQSLVENGRLLTSHIIPTSLTTPIERGLDQIEASTKRLLRRTVAGQQQKSSLSSVGGGAMDGSGGGGADSSQQQQPMGLGVPDSRTAYLLASRGIDSDRVMQNLVDINLGLSFEPLQGVADTDVEGYLRNEHETLVSLAVEETKRRAIADFEVQFENAVQKSWQRERRKIMENLGHKSMTMDIDSSHRGGFKAGQKTPISGMVSSGGLANNPRLKAYATVVRDINNAKLQMERFNAVSAFQKASERTTLNTDQVHITRLWGLFARMLDIKGEAGKLEAGHFAQVYKQTTKAEKSENATRFRIKLVEGGRAWLEDGFKDWINQHVREHRSLIGGMPTVDDIVTAYLNLKFFANNRWSLSWLDTSINNTPFWAHVFTLVRMGLRKDALRYMQGYSKELAASKDSGFLEYFKAWANSADGRLPKAKRDSLLNEWNARIRDSFTSKNATPKGDLFKYLLYKIIGRCEVGTRLVRNSDVIGTTEDFLWLQMCMIAEDGSATDPAFERYSLRDFSSQMQSLGKDYFKKVDTWFYVLLICGEFEKAVNELSIEPVFAGDALHFAVAMAFYGVLNVPESPRAIPLSSSLLSVTKIRVNNQEYEVFSFHFVRMITQFVQEWIRTDPVDVFHYIYLLGLFGHPIDSPPPNAMSQKEWDNGKEYTKCIHNIIRDILTESGRISQLLGRLNADGRGRSVGSIEKYRTLIHLSSEQEYMDRIILASAEQCDKEGRYKEALELYNLSNQPNKVIELLTRQISELLLSHSFASFSSNTGSVSQEGEESLFNQNPIENASRVLEYYKKSQAESSRLDPQVVYTCRTLISLANVATLANQGGPGSEEMAVREFYSLDLIPASNDMNAIQGKAESFNTLDESICRVIPSTLVLVSTCLASLYKQIAQGRSQERESRLMDIKARTGAILSFCGLIQYQIPQDIFASINRLDVMMA